MKHLVSKQLEQYNTVVVWGAGGLARIALQYWLPHKDVCGVISGTDTSLTSLSGHKVGRPSDLGFMRPDCIVVCTTAYVEVRQQLASLGYQGDIIYFYELLASASNATGVQALKLDYMATKNSSLLMVLMKKPQFFINITYRLYQELENRGLWGKFLTIPIIGIHYFLCALIGIQLPLDTQIGPGLVFAHPGTIVFTARAKIGAFVTIYHNCTIGTTTSGGNPIIEDFATIYANSLVLGGARIGKFARVGALSLVLDKTVPEFAVAVGAPARIIEMQKNG